MLQPVDITGGQVSGVDDLSAAASSVVNFDVDEAGVNRVRGGLTSYSWTNGTSVEFGGMAVWKNYVVAVTTDRKFHVLSEAVPTWLQTVSTSDTATQLEGTRRRLSFAIGDLYVYATGGGRIQRWRPALFAPEVITDSPLCTHIAAIGQRLVANDQADPSAIRWSDIGEGTWDTWPAANTMNADARPDPVVALFENSNELFVFGSETLQVYGIGADPTLPFEQVSAINVGIGSPYAACRLDEMFAFLDNRRRICLTDGRTVEPISDAIQKDLRNLTSLEHSWMARLERGQHSQLIACFPSSGKTWAYDLKGKRWSEWQTYVAPFQSNFAGCAAYVYWPARNQHLFANTYAAFAQTLTYMDETGHLDISAPIVAERVTGWQDYGTGNRKKSSRVEVTMRRGTAAEGATPGALEIRKQDDDGPWSKWVSISVGNPHQYQQVRKTFAFNGIFRRRRYHVRFSNTENFSLVGIQDDVTDVDAQVAA